MGFWVTLSNPVLFSVHPEIPFYVISTEGRNLKPICFQYNKISRSARNDNFGRFPDGHYLMNCSTGSHASLGPLYWN